MGPKYGVRSARIPQNPLEITLPDSSVKLDIVSGGAFQDGETPTSSSGNESLGQWRTTTAPIVYRTTPPSKNQKPSIKSSGIGDSVLLLAVLSALAYFYFR